MNKTLYKVIFNKKRGQMMAVPENVLGEGKSNGDARHRTGDTGTAACLGLGMGLLGFSLMLVLGSAMMLPEVAQGASIVADKSAPKNQQPTILRTANGLPQVNIQTPSAGGVSMNQYRQFDVDRQGAILNNSRNNTATRTAGWVQGNPWLAGGEARVIVNQVNSSNPSLLNGYIEVAGRRADIIMANPAGIQINGGGFINAAGITLTTSKPVISNGHLEGFRVREGHIGINGSGLDVRDANYTRILARAAQVNASIWGKDLGIISGSNDIDARGEQASNTGNTPSAGSGTHQPVIAIDTGRLGGMYAHKITLISTDKGVGVNNAGQLFAAAGGVHIDANGRIGNSGSIVAADTTHDGADVATVRLTGTELANSGSISAQGKAAIDTRSINNSGLIASASELDIRNQHSLVNSGEINAARLDIVSGNLDNRGNITQTGRQNLVVQAGNVSNLNQGLIGYTPVGSSNGSSSPDNTGGGRQATAPGTAAGGGITTPAPTPATPTLLADGRITVSGSLLNDKGQITANGATNLNARNGLNNQNSTLNLKQLSVQGGSTLNQKGSIRATEVVLGTTQIDNRGGSVDASNIRLQASALDNSGQGVIRSNGNAQLQITGSLNNDGGLLSATKELAIGDHSKQTLAISNADGKAVAGETLNLSAATLTSSGQIASQSNVNLNTRNLSNSGLLTAGKTLHVRNQQSLANSGEINATQLDIETSSLSNQKGWMVQTGSQSLVIDASKAGNSNGGLIGYTEAIASGGTGASVNLANGGGNLDNGNPNIGGGKATSTNPAPTPATPTALAAGRIAVSDSLLNDKGQITANGATSLNVRNGLGNQGSTLNLDQLSIQGSGTDNASGHINARQADIRTQTLNNQQGDITITDALKVRSEQMHNQGGKLLVAGQSDIRTDILNNGQRGVLAAGKRLTIQAQALNNQQGQLASSGEANLNIATLNNRQGTIDGSDVSIQTRHLDNRNQGVIRANNALTVQAGGQIQNQRGQISSARELAIHDNGTSTLVIDSNGGSILAGGDAQIQSKALANNGTLAAGNKLGIALQDDFTIGQDIRAGHTLRLNTQGRLINAHILQGGVGVVLKAQQIDNTVSGKIQSGNHTEVTATSTVDNRGLINSNGTTLVKAGGAVSNTGTGKIFGDHIAIGADTLINREETAASVSKAGTIAARKRLDIGARSIRNQEQALLYSDGVLSAGGSLDAQNQAAGLADSFYNSSARIESAGNMKLATRILRNLNTHFSTEEYLAGQSAQIREYAIKGQSIRYQDGKDGRWDRRSGEKDQREAVFRLKDGNQIWGEHWQIWDYHTKTYKEKIKTSAPGEIIVGGNLAAVGHDWLNQDSQILTGGAFIADGLTKELQNQATPGKERIETIGTRFVSTWEKRWFKRKKRPRRVEKDHQSYNSSRLLTHDFETPAMVYRAHDRSLVSSQPQMDKVGTVDAVAADHAGKAPEVISGQADTRLDSQPVTLSSIKTLSEQTRLPGSSLFHINPGKKGYLVETDPAFADYKRWLSSDHMLNALKLDPVNMHKRLGDGYYEQRLVNEQIARLTGHRRLDGYDNDEAQFRALMNAGVTFAKAQRLVPGIALSPEQIARLTSDIVWLESQSVTLDDGSRQTVLVPKVYVLARKGDINTAGSLISADQIQLNLQNGGLGNSGTIVGRQLVDLGAQNISNLAGGRITGKQVALNTTDSIDNIGGSIDAEQRLQLQARDIRIESTTQSSGDGRNGQTSIDRVAGLYVTGAKDGDMTVIASNQLDIKAARIGNQGGKTTLVGINAVNIGTLSEQKHEASTANSRNYRIEHQQTDVGSHINTQGNLTVYSKGAVDITQGQINSDEGTVAIAGQNVRITEGRRRSSVDASVHNRSNLGLSSHSIGMRGGEILDHAQGSSITGQAVRVQADKDVLIRGSNVVGQQSNRITAGNNITINAADNHSETQRHNEERRSGFTASLADGVASVGYGKSSHSLQQDSTAQSLTLSQVGSIKGNTTIVAGNQLTATAARLGASQDLTLQGKDVKLNADYISGSEHRQEKRKQAGVSVGLTYSPTMAAAAAYKKAKQNGGYSNSAVGKWMAHDNAVSKASMAAATPVVVTAGASTSRSVKDSSHREAVTTAAVAGGKLNIIATGGSIDSQGAQLSAESDALLHAKDNINLGFATDARQQTAHTRRRGFSLDNRDHFSPGGVYRDQGQGEGALTKTIGTQLSVGGQSVLQTQTGDINILGSTVVAKGDSLINAAGDVNIRSTQNSQRQSEQHHNRGIGTAQVSDTERFDGYISNKTASRSDQVEQIKSQIGSLDGNVQIQAGRNYTQQVADITAAQNIGITAQRIDILEDHNRGSQYRSEKDLKVGQFSKISSPLIDLVNAVDSTANSKADDRTRALQGMAAAAQGYQAYSAIANGGALVKVESGIGFKTARSQQDKRYAHSQSNALSASGNVTLKSSTSDIHAQHTQIKAGDTITLDSARAILLESGRNQQQADGNNSNAGLSVGVGASLGAQTGVYVYGEAGWGKGKNHLDANTHSNTTLQSDQLVLKSRGDTTLKGAQASARRIDADIGGKLHIESLQDQVEQSSSQTGVGVRVQVSLGTAWEVGGNYSNAKAKGSLNAVGWQSGLFAGEGGYHIKANEVALKGGAITATAGKEYNELSTGKLSFEDIGNHSDYRASSVALAGSYGSHSPSENPGNTAFRQTALGKAFANSAGSKGADYTPSVPQHESGSETSSTRATLSAGNLSIGGKATTVEELGIHSDPASAHQQLAGLPDLQAILEKQQTVAQATGTIASAVRTFNSDRVKAAEKEKAEARAQTESTLKQRNDGSWESYQNLAENQKQQWLTSHSTSYAAASDVATSWGTGGGKSRALNAVSTAITGALGGQGGLQVAANTLAPYAAETIGRSFGHNGSTPSKTAQLFSHAVLGATLAYINGGKATSGAVAGAGSEAAAIYLTQTLYKDQATDPATGKPDPDRLPEKDKEHIRDLTAAIGAVAGGIAGDSAASAQIAGVVGRNAVENNYLTAVQWASIEAEFLQCKTQKCKNDVAKKSRQLNRQQDKNLADAVRKAARGDTQDWTLLQKIHGDDAHNREILITTLRRHYPELTYEQILQKADFYQKEANTNPNWGWKDALVRVKTAYPTEYLAAVTNLTKDVYDFTKPGGAGGAAAVLNIKKDHKKLKPAKNTVLIHKPAPKSVEEITGFKGLRDVKSKTSVQGGGGQRARWKDKKGNIYEWDSRHGTLEKYNKNGRHLGEFDYKTGEQLKPAISSRRIEP